MRLYYSLIISSALLTMLPACDQNGGPMPIDSKKLLSTFDGPNIPSMEENQLAAAKNAEKNDDFAQASQIYQQILEKDPETNDVVQLLADSLRRGGEYDKAISVYDGLLTKDPANVPAKEGKALALMAKGDFETPTILLEEVLKADGKRWKSLNAMGILFVTRGLYPDSIKYFEEALKQSPANVSVMNNLGLTQALNKQYDVAIDTLSKASLQSVVGSSGRKRIDLNMALVYASSGKLPEARRIAEQYLSGPSLNNNLGLYAHLAKDDALAKSYLNMALTESKTYYEKAWDNLEALDKEDAKGYSKIEKPAAAPEKKPEGKTKGKKEKTASAVKTGKITVVQEPDITAGQEKSIGEIIAHEIKDDKTASKTTAAPVTAVVATPPAATTAAPASALPDVNKLKTEPVPLITPNAVKQDAPVPSVDNVIDNIAKPPADAKTVKVESQTQPPAEASGKKTNAKSLGTIKTTATSKDKDENSADDSDTQVPVTGNIER